MSDPLSLKAAILDWAGTVVDHGSRAPIGAFVRAFAAFGVTIGIADARGPMGMAKWDHIRAVGHSPAVAAAWRAAHGRDFAEADVDAIFQVFEPMNIAAVRDHAELIPGTVAAIETLRARGMRMPVHRLYPGDHGRTGADRRRGRIRPEFTICAGDLPAGRPSPVMMLHAMARLGVWPAHCVVKVDDTAPGIGEGAAAGTWTVGIALTGNAGHSADELAALDQRARATLGTLATAELSAAGADLVIDGIAELPAAAATIDARLAAGGRPRAATV